MFKYLKAYTSFFNIDIIMVGGAHGSYSTSPGDSKWNPRLSRGQEKRVGATCSCRAAVVPVP